MNRNPSRVNIKQLCGRIRRWYYNLTPAESKFKTPMLNHQDKYMMKAQAVHKELGDSLVRAATTASSLEAKQDSCNINKTQSKETPNEPSSQETILSDGPRCQEAIGDTTAQTRFESVSKHSNDSLLARGNTLQIDDDRLELNILMTLCTNLQTRVLTLEKTKTTESNEIDNLKKRVKKLEKKNKSRTYKLKRLYKVGLTARVESSDEESLGEDASKQGRRIDAIDQDKDITLVNVQDDAEMFDVEDLGDEKTSKPKVKGIVIQEQEHLGCKHKTRRVVDTEKATLFVQLLEKRRKHFAAKRAEEKMNKLPTQAQKKQIMCNYLKNMEGYMLKQLKLKEFDEIQEKIHKEGKKSYYQIMRADKKTRMYMVFSKMLEIFNRKDLKDLYKLLRAKFKSTRPMEDLDLLLWGDLKTMFEPHVEDKVCKNQQGYKVLKFFITVLLPPSLPSPRLFFSLVGCTHIHVSGDGAQMLGFLCLNDKDLERMRRISEDGDALHILRDEMGKDQQRVYFYGWVNCKVTRLEANITFVLRPTESILQWLGLITKPRFFYDHSTKQALGFENPFYLKKAQQLEPKLYDGNAIKNTCTIVILDSEETLMLAEESHSKMILKQQDPMILEKKVNTKPVDYNSMNFLDPSPSSTPIRVDVLKELPKVSMVYTSLKKLKHHLTGFDVVIKESVVLEIGSTTLRDKVIVTLSNLK
nr:hypothetical protein [Tanacetum cinerariifolium]